jgi:hypothetical protein
LLIRHERKANRGFSALRRGSERRPALFVKRTVAGQFRPQGKSSNRIARSLAETPVCYAFIVAGPDKSVLHGLAIGFGQSFEGLFGGILRRLARRRTGRGLLRMGRQGNHPCKKDRHKNQRFENRFFIQAHVTYSSSDKAEYTRAGGSPRFIFADATAQRQYRNDLQRALLPRNTTYSGSTPAGDYGIVEF